MKRILLAVLGCAFATSAEAAMITNMDRVAHQVTVNNGGNQHQVTLEPNRSYSTYGVPVGFKLDNGMEQITRDSNEYVIWPGGKLMLQKRVRYGHDGKND